MPRDTSSVASPAAQGSGTGLQRMVPAKTRKRALLLLVAAVAIGVGAAVWQLTEKRGACDAYRTAATSIADGTSTLPANGTLNPVVLVNVGTQVSGTVMKLHVDFNDHVKAGQVLLELDPALLQAQVRLDEANLSNARATLVLAGANEARSKTLWAQDSIAKQA